MEVAMVMELPPTRDNAPYHHIIDGHGFPMAMRRRDSPFPCYLFFLSLYHFLPLRLQHH